MPRHDTPAEVRERALRNSPWKSRPILNDDGRAFPSLTEAARSEGISRQAMQHRLARGSFGWRYADAEAGT